MSEKQVDKHLTGTIEGGWDYMRSQIPELKAIMESGLVDNVKVTRLEVEEALQAIVRLDVEAPTLLPHPRQALINSGLVKKHNIHSTSENETSHGLNLRFYGARILAFLDIKK